ncbi:FHA domain-containing protein [Pseudanabaena sp. FACHB-1277]|uniref:FHA domain-containing protein n=2 Tax=Pseudanabaena TaxID=1152 RepID=A0A926USW6_9CYAN|nr:FHA domain-containing protein [Pseudanabaena cinerea FACHB-1277]
MDKKARDESEISVSLSSDPTLIVTDNSGTRKVALTQDKYTIGRDEDNAIRLDSDFVSRHHAYVIRVQSLKSPSMFRIIDGSTSGKLSKNGLVVNAMQSVRSHDLNDGDIVTFAPEVHILYLAPR